MLRRVGEKCSRLMIICSFTFFHKRSPIPWEVPWCNDRGEWSVIVICNFPVVLNKLFELHVLKSQIFLCHGVAGGKQMHICICTHTHIYKVCVCVAHRTAETHTDEI